MLPAPQHAPIKEINRPLVPHSLTKKPSKPLTPIPKSSPSRPAFPKPSTKTKHLPGVPEDDSDEDESGANFFSLGSSSTTQSSKASLSSTSTSASYMSKIASTIQTKVDVEEPETVTKTVANDNKTDESGQSVSLAVDEYVSPSDAPLSFKPRAGGYHHSHWGRSTGGVSANQMYNLANIQDEEEQETTSDTQVMFR